MPLASTRILFDCQGHSFSEFLSITTVASFLLAKKSSKIVPTSIKSNSIRYALQSLIYILWYHRTLTLNHIYSVSILQQVSDMMVTLAIPRRENPQVHLLHQCWPPLVPDDGKGLSFQPLTLTTHKTTRSFDAQMTRKQENHGKPQGLSSCNSFSWPRVVLELQDQRQVPGKKLQGCTPLDPPHLAESLGDTCIGDWSLTQSIYCIYNIITLYTRYWVASFQSFSTPCCNTLTSYLPVTHSLFFHQRLRHQHLRKDAKETIALPTPPGYSWWIEEEEWGLTDKMWRVRWGGVSSHCIRLQFGFVSEDIIRWSSFYFILIDSILLVWLYGRSAAVLASEILHHMNS